MKIQFNTLHLLMISARIQIAVTYRDFVSILNRQYLSFWKKMDANGHFEIARGTLEQDLSYCSRYNENKEFRTDLFSIGRNNKFKVALQTSQNGELVSIKNQHSGLCLRYKSVLESIRIIDLTKIVYMNLLDPEKILLF